MDVERPGRVRGFSLAELLLTLALLLAVVLGVLYVVDRRTRLLPEPARASDLESRLAAAL
jgi:Tfp pilus assembly protein PilW